MLSLTIISKCTCRAQKQLCCMASCNHSIHCTNGASRKDPLLHKRFTRRAFTVDMDSANGSECSPERYLTCYMSSTTKVAAANTIMYGMLIVLSRCYH